MSETPRTDAMERPYNNTLAGERSVPMDFARQLERELAAMTANRDRLRLCLQESITAHTGCDAAGEYVCGPGYTDAQMERWMKEVA